MRARAKSVFHFNVQGSVAKSTHAGIPWLRYIRQHTGGVHFWPFDGWSVPPNCSVLAEVYPALWSRTFPSMGRTTDQQDAFATAEWLRRADANGSLAQFLMPELEPVNVRQPKSRVGFWVSRERGLYCRSAAFVVVSVSLFFPMTRISFPWRPANFIAFPKRVYSSSW